MRNKQQDVCGATEKLRNCFFNDVLKHNFIFERQLLPSVSSRVKIETDRPKLCEVLYDPMIF